MTSRRPTKTRGGRPSRASAERDPAGVIQEVYALALGHFVTRSPMFSCCRRSAGPGSTVVPGCFQILECRLPECNSSTPEAFEQWYRGLLWELQGERTDGEVRRNRINPRVIKRKMSKWKKKRPEHRRRSTLEENLYRDSGYASLNGIGLKPRSRPMSDRVEPNGQRHPALESAVLAVSG